MNRAVYEAEPASSQFLSGIMQPLMNVIGNLGYVAVCVLGAALVMNGQHQVRRHHGLHPLCAPVHLTTERRSRRA